MALLSILCYIYFFLTGAIGIAVAIIVRLASFPFDPDCLIIHHLVKAFVRHYLWAVPGWNLQIEGSDKIRSDSPYVIVSNHQSAFDPILLYLLPTYFKWTAKTWVFKMPVVGWLLLLTRHLEINKKHPGKFLSRCRTLLNRGVSVLLFPEGTRSDDGQLLPFKFGAFHLAVAENVPVLPVVLCGTRKVIPKGRFFSLGLKADLAMRILDPVSPGTDENELRRRVRQEMQIALSQMSTENEAIPLASPLAQKEIA